MQNVKNQKDLKNVNLCKADVVRLLLLLVFNEQVSQSGPLRILVIIFYDHEKFIFVLLNILALTKDSRVSLSKLEELDLGYHALRDSLNLL